MVRLLQSGTRIAKIVPRNSQRVYPLIAQHTRHASYICLLSRHCHVGRFNVGFFLLLRLAGSQVSTLPHSFWKETKQDDWNDGYNEGSPQTGTVAHVFDHELAQKVG
jgi:hypothetical protein